MKRVEIPYGDEGKNIHFVFPADSICQKSGTDASSAKLCGAWRAQHVSFFRRTFHTRNRPDCGAFQDICIQKLDAKRPKCRNDRGRFLGRQGVSSGVKIAATFPEK